MYNARNYACVPSGTFLLHRVADDCVVAMRKQLTA